MSLPSISVKEILADPRHACEARWPEKNEAEEKFLAASALIDSLAALKPALKNKRTEKQECARDFGRIKADGGDLAAQKARMQCITTELTELEQKQHELEIELLNLFEPAAVTPQLFPVRFDEYSRSKSIAVTIASIENNERNIWDAYVEAHPQASLYHLYRWRTVVETSFDHDSFYLAAKNANGEVCGVLPLIRLRSRLFGDFAISMPFFNYGGPLADNARITQQLLDEAGNIARRFQLAHLEIRATHPLDTWPARTDKVSMIKQLPATIEQLDEDIGTKIRAQIKRARQENVEVRVGHMDLLDDFYRVFAINMRDLGTPVYGKNFFRNILSIFPEQSYIVSIRLRGKPVAAAFLLGFRDMLEIPWASTLRSANALNMNMLLYREILGLCIERG